MTYDLTQDATFLYLRALGVMTGGIHQADDVWLMNLCEASGDYTFVIGQLLKNRFHCQPPFEALTPAMCVLLAEVHIQHSTYQKVGALLSLDNSAQALFETRMRFWRGGMYPAGSSCAYFADPLWTQELWDTKHARFRQHIEVCPACQQAAIRYSVFASGIDRHVKAAFTACIERLVYVKRHEAVRPSWVEFFKRAFFWT